MYKLKNSLIYDQNAGLPLKLTHNYNSLWKRKIADSLNMKFINYFKSVVPQQNKFNTFSYLTPDFENSLFILEKKKNELNYNIVTLSDIYSSIQNESFSLYYVNSLQLDKELFVRWIKTFRFGHEIKLLKLSILNCDKETMRGNGKIKIQIAGSNGRFLLSDVKSFNCILNFHYNVFHSSKIWSLSNTPEIAKFWKEIKSLDLDSSIEYSKSKRTDLFYELSKRYLGLNINLKFFSFLLSFLILFIYLIITSYAQYLRTILKTDTHSSTSINQKITWIGLFPNWFSGALTYSSLIIIPHIAWALTLNLYLNIPYTFLFTFTLVVMGFTQYPFGILLGIKDIIYNRKRKKIIEIFKK